MPEIEKREITDQGQYCAGKSDAANHKILGRNILRRLRSHADYWQGFHEERPNSFDRFQTTVLEDPTRPTGWIYKQ